MTTADMNAAMSAPCALCALPADECLCHRYAFPGTVIPAYGRFYHNTASVISHLTSGKDFRYVAPTLQPPNAYISLRDLKDFSGFEFSDPKTGLCIYLTVDSDGKVS